MAVITPHTDLYLLKVPLEINDINQLDFASKTAQFNYFNSLPKIAVDDFTYQRKDSSIRFPVQFDEIITYNYVMYRNSEYSDKWFYAFITDIQYINDNMSLITIKTDVWQTWQFDLTYKPCLVEREHANTDVAGDNTLPENLELGDVVTNGTVTNFVDSSSYCTVLEVSMIENEGENSTLSYEWEGGTAYNPTPTLNGITRGTIPLVTDLTSDSPFMNSITSVYDLAGLGDAIVNVYMLPKTLIGSYNMISLYATNGTSSLSVYHVAIPEATTATVNLGTNTFTKPTSISNYTPKNKKLLTYPYCYFNISNNAGTSLPYRYEDFSSSVSFKTEGTFGVSGSTKTIPQNYKRMGTSDNAMDYSVTGPKYPSCSWKSDSYTNWLTQNAVNIATEWKTTLIGAAGEVAGGAFVGGAGGLIMGGVAAGKNILALAREQMLARTSANLVPDQVKGNQGAGDFLWAKYRSPFTYIPMSIKAEYARCIDDYFSHFGYATNRIKRPNLTGRRNWNYVKTISCYIEADIPQDDLSEIKSMFDKGITIWHNPLYFGDYSQNNDII